MKQKTIPRIEVFDIESKSERKIVDAPMGLDFFFGTEKINIRVTEDGIKIRKTSDDINSLIITPEASNTIHIR